MKVCYSSLTLLFCLIQNTIAQTGTDFNSIIQEHIKLLGNLDKTNPPLMLLFSATPGMGKTTIATKIAAALSALKITVDDARRLLIQHAIPMQGQRRYQDLSIEEKIACIVEYLDQFIKEIRKISGNRFIIIDDTINQWYGQIQRIADKHAMPTFLIRLVVSKATACERIREREANPQEYLASMDHWYQLYENFNAGPFDYLFCNEHKFDEKQFQELLSLLKSTVLC